MWAPIYPVQDCIADDGNADFLDLSAWKKVLSTPMFNQTIYNLHDLLRSQGALWMGKRQTYCNGLAAVSGISIYYGNPANQSRFHRADSQEVFFYIPFIIISNIFVVYIFSPINENPQK